MSEEIKQEGDFKIQKRKPAMKKLNTESQVTKVDLTAKKEEDAIQEQATNESMLGTEQSEVGLQEVVQGNEEHKESAKQDEKEVIVINAQEPSAAQVVEELKNEINDAIAANENSGVQLPENIEKLVSFMQETGGTVEDYVRLSADYSTISTEALLKEYYKKSRPHLDNEEIEFMMEDNFSYDEDEDDERDIKKKKLAFKEEVAKARTFLEDLKNKYYDEIKLKPSINKDQQKALDFFNRYNEDQKAAESKHLKFKDDTKKFFTQDFKGFDFNLGEKTFKYNIPNNDAVVEKQSNITNLVKKFLNNNGEVSDLNGYHKAMYAAENIDTIVKHFYEQGKADAVKEVVAKSNNITTESRKMPTGDVFVNGLKVRAINGVDSSKLKIQKRT
jgi:hypothetical protein